MRCTRRSFLGTALGAGTCSPARPGHAAEDLRPIYEKIDKAASAPILNTELWPKPVKIASMELLRNRRNFLVRVRTTDGAEGIGVPNAMHLVHTYPIFLNRVAPFFVGKDARQLEPLLWELYRHDDNYKYQGLALWVCVAAAEFAILDLLGKLAGKSIGDLLGGVKRREIAVYRASGIRGNTPEAGGRLPQAARRRDRGQGAQVPPRRPHEQERRLAARADREADPAGPRGVRQGDDALRRLEQLLRRAQGHRDRPADGGIRLRASTKSRAGSTTSRTRRPSPTRLRIPVAGGEQEFSEYRFRWMIANRGLDIVQPDLHYYGGFIRSMRVARMAHAAGLLCTPHMSGSGLGYLDAAHLRLVHPQPRPVHGIQGRYRHPRQQRDLVAEVRERHGPGAVRARASASPSTRRSSARRSR